MEAADEPWADQCGDYRHEADRHRHISRIGKRRRKEHESPVFIIDRGIIYVVFEIVQNIPDPVHQNIPSFKRTSSHR